MQEFPSVLSYYFNQELSDSLYYFDVKDYTRARERIFVIIQS